MLKTKLHRPPVTAEHVYREHLIEQLNKNQYKPFTLVSAPAGYGKSMLISSWLEKSKFTYAWVSLNEDDNELYSFLNCVYQSILKIHPNTLKDFGKLIKVNELPPLSIISETLINELDAISGEFVFVLDDFHLLHNQQINQLLDLLLKYPPEDMHLVILTRRDPALNLSSLRAHSRMNEIRTADLCFRKDEIAKLFKHLVDADLNEETIDRLHDKTEGWVTGLRLASLIISGADEANQKLLDIKGDLHIVADFLLREVLLNQKEHIQESLLKLSIVDRFCPELIDNAFSPEKIKSEKQVYGKEIINSLLTLNLFVISLDSENKWFRFHHFFQNLLQNQFKQNNSKDKINHYHKQASFWFDENGLIEEAIKHALLGNDMQFAITLVEKYRYELMNSAQWNRLANLVKMFPRSIKDSNPLFLSTLAYIGEYRGELAEIVVNRDKAKAILGTLQDKPKMRKMLTGELMVLDSELQLLEGNALSSLKNAEESLKLLPENAYHIWSYAIGEIVLSHQMKNNIEVGFEFIKELKVEQKLTNDLTRARMELWYCMAYKMDGDMHRLKLPSLECIRLGEENDLQESIAFGRYFLGSAHYMLNELEEAELYLKAIVNDPYTARPNYLVQGAFLLALIYAKQGNFLKASDIINSVVSYTTETRDTVAQAIAKSMQIELKLMQGKVDEAFILDDSFIYEILPPMWFYYVPQLTKIKILLAKNTAESLVEAIAQIKPLEEFLRKSNRKRILVDLLAIYALVLDSQGKKTAAYEKIIESLNLAAAGGTIRNYIDLGNPIISLIKELPAQELNNQYIEQIIHDFNQEKTSSITVADASALNSLNPAFIDINKLSLRESDVLKQLAKGLRNKEIAEELFISTDTVKKHLKNIFLKLDVSSRIHAIKKAIDLGILETE